MSDPTIDMLLNMGLRYIKRTDVDRIRDRMERGDFDPCQTHGCENEADEHPTACTMCADREAEHGV